MRKLLLVEDDPNLGSLLQEYLHSKHYATDWAKDGQEGWEMFLKETYHLCIFDVMMPKKDGFALAKEVRMSGKSDVPIIFLTAKSMKEDTIQGLKLGGDDYLTKPFERDVLLARIEAVLRRYERSGVQSTPPNKEYRIGSYLFHYDTHQLSHASHSTRLTSKESELLKLFCENLNQPVGRSYALKMIWGDDSYFNARSMDVYITKLRKHLKDDPSVQIINLHGEGFRLVV
jgi:DNA-binding response OmpR family regulator